MSKQLAFVQFPHPGGEHRPTSDVMPWNNGEHGRKFLKGTGTTYVTVIPTQAHSCSGANGNRRRSSPNTRRRQTGLPRWVHEPIWKEPERHRLLQNTDPLVFGEHFLYSNCRQSHVPSLRALAPGSVVVFGSKLAGSWVVDSVFVVGDNSIGYIGGEAGSIESDQMTRAVLLDRIASNPKNRRAPFTLYRGRWYFDGADEPFSFVPCRPYVASFRRDLHDPRSRSRRTASRRT